MERLTITQKIMLPQSYREHLRKQMEERGVTQEEAARHINVKQPNLNAALQGKAGLSETQFKNLAHFLGLGAIARLEIDLYRLR